MPTKTVIARAIQVVTFIFAAFGQFLLNIAPPTEGRPNFAVGLASFFALTVLLWLTAAARGLPAEPFKRRWLTASAIALVIAIVTAPIYLAQFERRTFAYPSASGDTRYVRGTDLTDRAQRYMQDNPGLPVQILVAHFGGPDAEAAVWTESSVSASRILLTSLYLLLVLGMATSIFALTEGILTAEDRKEVGPEPSDETSGTQP